MFIFACDFSPRAIQFIKVSISFITAKCDNFFLFCFLSFSNNFFGIIQLD